MTVIRYDGDVVFANGEFEIDEIDLCLNGCATERNSLVGIERITGHDHQAGVHDLVAEQELGNGRATWARTWAVWSGSWSVFLVSSPPRGSHRLAHSPHLLPPP